MHDRKMLVCYLHGFLPPHPLFCPLFFATKYFFAVTLGIDVDNIAVMGSSAGGGLAAALALMVRDRHEYQFVCTRFSFSPR